MYAGFSPQVPFKYPVVTVHNIAHAEHALQPLLERASSDLDDVDESMTALAEDVEGQLSALTKR